MGHWCPPRRMSLGLKITCKICPVPFLALHINNHFASWWLDFLLLVTRSHRPANGRRYYTTRPSPEVPGPPRCLWLSGAHALSGRLRSLRWNPARLLLWAPPGLPQSWGSAWSTSWRPAPLPSGLLTRPSPGCSHLLKIWVSPRTPSLIAPFFQFARRFQESMTKLLSI